MMKVKVEFLSLQLITQVLGKKKIEVDFKGTVFSDLLSNLSGQVRKFKEMVLEHDGTVAHDIQVYINGEAGADRTELHSRMMNEGDNVTFMFLVAGG
jgi:molybdopterin converting factor small subunit